MPGADLNPSLRERKKARTRQALEACAVQLFSERGFEATTVDDIATAADVSPRTFFRYFASKEDAVLGAARGDLDAAIALLRARPAGEPLALSLRSIVLGQADHWERERERMVGQTRLLLRTPALRARYLELLDAGAAAMAEVVVERVGGGAGARLRARVVAGAVLGAANAVVQHWIEGGAAEHLPTLMHEALDVVAEGLTGR